MPIRGSRKHVLDLIDLGGPAFIEVMNGLLESSPLRLHGGSIWRPLGHHNNSEWYLHRFCQEFCQGSFDYQPLLGWWVPEPWRPPTWDLIATGRVGDQFGVLLVEAKANESEFDWGGKRLSPSASIGSKRNHNQIDGCIQEANVALDDLCDGVFNLSIRSHYQLANRVAHLWKLATCGIPVVLLYLGFTGDTYFGDHFRLDGHWQRSMGGYLQGVVPQGIIDRPVIPLANGGTMQFLVRSRQVLGVSI